MANCSALPGLSSLKIKSDETNLFCIKLRKLADISNYFTTFLQNSVMAAIILKSHNFYSLKVRHYIEILLKIVFTCEQIF